MPEIDPDVAALLDDLPPTKLPDILVEQGWGQKSQRQVTLEKGMLPVAPSTSQQPTFTHHCAQCGRPITPHVRGWTDHAGRTACPSDLVERVAPGHIIESDMELWRERHSQELSAEMQRLIEAKRRFEERQKQPCKEIHRGRTHTCVCEHKYEHFGFHECHQCRRLWR